MARSSLVRIPMLYGALIGATGTVLFAPLASREALARVGITSATEGDPLGKPPQEAERVLRIGIDVQANELITTNANDRAHLVFLDGSSLTVGPNAQLTIEKFVFDPNNKTGDLTISATKGVLRLVGGKISKNNPIRIDTPAGTIGIRGGITILDVGANKTESTFVFGKDMTVTASGVTQTATRPGSIITTPIGGPPGMPQILPRGALNGQLGQLEGRPSQQGGGAPAPAASAPGGGSGAAGGAGNAARAPDRLVQSSGLSTANSSQPVRIIAPTGETFGSGPGPRNRNPNDTIVTALSNTNPASAPSVAPNTTSAIIPEFQQQKTNLPAAPTAITTSNFNQPTAVQPTASPAGTGGSTASVAEVNQLTSVATFVGGMVGVVNNRKIETGSYQNVWNFGSRSGVATIRFDDARFQANTVQNGNSANFTTQGRVPAQTGNRSIELNGSFVSTPGKPANYQIGSFNINGGGYNANGIFAGQR